MSRLDYPATTRNRDAILAVLREVLPPTGTVLEIASGSGQHAAWFATHLPGLEFQPTDTEPAALASIEAWCADLPNVRPALHLDVREPWPVDAVDAVFNANMIHISPWEAGLALIEGAARVLRPGGLLVMYGPYKVGGQHTAPSNEAFDASLRARDPSWGVRDLDVVKQVAASHGLHHERTVQMPANNITVAYRRHDDR